MCAYGCVCVLYLDLLQQHGRVGEVVDVVGGLHHLRDGVCPLREAEQRIPEETPQLQLRLRTKSGSSALHTETGGGRDSGHRV